MSIREPRFKRKLVSTLPNNADRRPIHLHHWLYSVRRVGDISRHSRDVREIGIEVYIRVRPVSEI